VIEHKVPFVIVGPAWVFDANGAKQFRKLAEAHKKNAAALGIKPRPHKATPVTS
jgi:hypothetical protein